MSPKEMDETGISARLNHNVKQNDQLTDRINHRQGHAPAQIRPFRRRTRTI